jgi:hypothetical protein
LEGSNFRKYSVEVVRRAFLWWEERVYLRDMHEVGGNEVVYSTARLEMNTLRILVHRMSSSFLW